MLPYLLLFTISAVTAQDCNYTYENRLYSRKILLNTSYDDIKNKDIATLATNLVYDRRSGALLFTLVNLDSLEYEVKTLMDEYKYHNGKSTKIQNFNGQGQAAAVDLKNGIIYVASNRCLNVLDYLYTLNGTDVVEHVPYLEGTNIVQLVKPANKDVLYYVTSPEYNVFVYNTTTKEADRLNLPSFAFSCAVDSHDNIYFVSRDKNVELVVKDFHVPIKFIGLRNNTARFLSVDDTDRVILATNDGLYHLRPDNVIPKKLMNLDFIPGGIAFNNDTIFLSTNQIIYEFSPC